MQKYCRDEIAIVVRSVGERTEEKCISNLRKQFCGSDLYIVKGISPFSKALKESYYKGISSGKPYVLVIDADVFLMDSKIDIFVYAAIRMCEIENSNIFCVQPYIYDKIFDKPRLAGVHFYNASHLPTGINFCDNSSLRPETHVKQTMNSIGYPTCIIPLIIGIHDFFQSYSSLIKKGILHSNKHADVNEYVEEWMKKKDKVPDYKFVLLGIELGKNHSCIKADDEQMNRIIHDDGISIPEQNELTDEEIDYELSNYEFVTIWEYAFESRDKRKRSEYWKDALLQYEFFRYLKKFKTKWFR